jgi:hypothetical protein
VELKHALTAGVSLLLWIGAVVATAWLAWPY